MVNIKILVEKHPDGYVAYPLGLKGVIVGEGDTYEDALADVKSAIAFHVDTFGEESHIDGASEPRRKPHPPHSPQSSDHQRAHPSNDLCSGPDSLRRFS